MPSPSSSSSVYHSTTAVSSPPRSFTSKQNGGSEVSPGGIDWSASSVCHLTQCSDWLPPGKFGSLVPSEESQPSGPLGSPFHSLKPTRSSILT